MAQEIKKNKEAEKVCSGFVPTFIWAFPYYRRENNSLDLEESARNRVRRESIQRFCSDKMIARGWNILEITGSPRENNRPCFCDEDYRSCRQALGSSAHCASDIMAPHSSRIVRG